MKSTITAVIALAWMFLRAPVVAWVPSNSGVRTTVQSSTTQLYQSLSRSDFMKATGLLTVVSTSAFGFVGPKPQAAWAVETLPNGVTYEVVKSGSGPKPEIGELVAIRFAAYWDDKKIDDIFDTPEPYYTRIGSGGLLKGVEETLPLMQLGDRWKLTIPSNLAFGSKGRQASAGKPRIPGGATIVFEVEMVGLPGKEPELIELIGDV